MLDRTARADGGGAIAWRQAVDLIAQQEGDPVGEARDALEKLRAGAPLHMRQATAQALACPQLPPALVAHFGRDVASVAQPVLSAVQLSDADWAAIVPELAPSSRSLLRERRDLPAGVSAMLGAYGPGDSGLPHPESIEIVREGEGQIGALVARIEAFRARREQAAVSPADIAATTFQFETTADGIVAWLEGAPRGPVIGIDVSTMAEPGEHGVDGQVAGAFRSRAAFRDGRLLVPGGGPVSGQWLVSGLPGFRESDGRFTGYRCMARRPGQGELAFDAGATPILGGALSADTVRQLVHELRTPLNAIRGFAEMIESQMRGPVALPYRDHAAAIVAEAQRLDDVFDDLDAAARLESGAIRGNGDEPVDLSAIVAAAAGRLRQATERKNVRLRIQTPEMPVIVTMARPAAERIVGRLLGSCVALARQNEMLTATLSTAQQRAVLAIDRPGALENTSNDALLGPGDDHGGEGLGLGFALRLIRATARAAGGGLSLGPDRFAIDLPAAADGAGVRTTQS